jgi:hypothetical protein
LEIDVGSYNAGEIDVQDRSTARNEISLGEKYFVIESSIGKSSFQSVPSDLVRIVRVHGKKRLIEGTVFSTSRAELKDFLAQIFGIGNSSSGIDRLQDVSAIDANEGVALFLWNKLGDSSTDLVHLLEDGFTVYLILEYFLKGSND